jgi:type VI protein secretion system component VasF
VAPDISREMLAAVTELERELAELKQRIDRKAPEEIREEDVDTIRYIQGEIQAALGE